MPKTKTPFQVIERAVREGKLDNYLDQMISIVNRRKRVLGMMSEDLVVGEVFKVKRIRPRYLVGAHFEVKKVNRETVSVDIPDEPKFQTWRGKKGVRIHKSCIERI